MTDEIRWGVGNRAGALAALNTTVQNNGACQDGVLYYPGAGDDILHALFAANARTRYFIFVDPNATLGVDIPVALRVGYSALTGSEARPILSNIGIGSVPNGSWMFGFKGSQRFVFWFQGGHSEFLNANPNFQWDMFFEKDFWETPESIDMECVRTRTRLNGFFSTNSSAGGLVSLLKLIGFAERANVELNGPQKLFQRYTYTRVGWSEVQDKLIKAQARVMTCLYDDDRAFDPMRKPQATELEKLTELVAALHAARDELAPLGGSAIDLARASVEILRKGMGVDADYNGGAIAEARQHAYPGVVL